MGPNTAVSGGFREQFIYQKALNLVIEMMALSRRIPEDERHGLGHQIRNAATSIGTNIARGYKMRSTREYIGHLTIAYDSCGELQLQTDAAFKLKLITQNEYDVARALEEEVSKLLWASIKTLKRKAQEERDEAHYRPSLNPDSQPLTPDH